MKTHNTHRAMMYCALRAVVGVLMIGSASAVNYTWNKVTGTYTDAANWGPAGGPPTSADRAYISNGGTATLAAGATGAGNLVLISGASSLTVSGGNLTSQTVQLGAANDATTGTMNISSGSVTTSTYVQVGQYAVDTGIVNMSGGTLAATTNGFVGDAGNGQFNLTGGNATFGVYMYVGSAATGTGTLSISAGSLTTGNSGVRVGSLGNGTVNVSDSGTLKAGPTGTAVIIVANSAGSTGTLNVGIGGTAGTVTAAEVFGGSGTATVKFNHTGALSFAPLLKGSLSVTKSGAGTT
ncbi:MAG: hypothetical protein ACOYM3_14825, partial [Terrimicrobiaceae bacterium]